ILLVPLSSVTGYRNGQWQNAGTLLGKTHELALGASLVDRPEFSWRLNVAADRTPQTITQLSEAPFLVGPDYAGNNEGVQMFRIAPRQTFGGIYGTKIVRSSAQLSDDQSNKPTAAGCSGSLPACYSTGKKPISYYQAVYNGINPIDFFVEPGTYVKIKELNVSYTFDRSTLAKLGLGINSLRLGVIGRNLFTFTKYSGYDPEVAGLSGDPYSFRVDG